MEDLDIEARILEILGEFSQLKQLDIWDLTLTAASQRGDVEVLLKYKTCTIQKVIHFNDDLSFISDTFSYPTTMCTRSKPICLEGVKEIFFDDFGNMVVQRDDAEESFKVKPEHKDLIQEALKPFYDRVKPVVVEEKVVKPIVGELLYKVMFTDKGKSESFIVAGESIEALRVTALSELNRRNLSFEKNHIYSESINNH